MSKPFLLKLRWKKDGYRKFLPLRQVVTVICFVSNKYSLCLAFIYICNYNNSPFSTETFPFVCSDVSTLSPKPPAPCSSNMLPRLKQKLPRLKKNCLSWRKLKLLFESVTARRRILRNNARRESKIQTFTAKNFRNLLRKWIQSKRN
jgi:hypothetical protein